ncbi:hypothetical protein J4727_17930 [Providencia rettgeri]|uniref:Uncharacterized protein n=1 Tax=Providencia rettgeri TaxID=587 RepID=A0A939SLX8_PRORE|nr:hypothetical protein [Providencia rettgeri]
MKLGNSRVMMHLMILFFQAIKEDQGIPVYTIHTEVEGMSKSVIFTIIGTNYKKISNSCTLSELLPDDLNSLPKGRGGEGKSTPICEGWPGCQEEE